ncbi:hypothetical protein [Yersinia intermedia]|uniref:hypothetical protein n=1 Tax=Yersinia intermedia TaxID=631 RepID=UPI00065CE53D|nr:hypothetical protein [Yersinia intermedia]CRY84161.1 Uncharacterised protein [Yersinia intermedia]
MNKEIIKKAINDAAAFLFWKHAERVGVQSASNDVLATNGSCLLRQDFSNEVFDNYYDFQSIDLETTSAFKEEVAAHAVAYCQTQENIIGTIYIEDLKSGRSHTANNIDVSDLNNNPVSIKGNKPPKFGKLCIRHPLPAVVICESEPSRTIFKIADTATALGFSITMYMGPIDITPIAENMWLVTGIIYIPVPTIKIGDDWNRVIQNKVSMVSGLTMPINGKMSQLEFEWEGDTETPLKIILSKIGRFFK